MDFYLFFGVVVSFIDNIDNAGNGVLSKKNDIILSTISLAFDFISLFVTIPGVDIIVSSAGTIIPKVIAMRLGGFVLC